MRRLSTAASLALATLTFLACASAPPFIYPPVEGTWMYDYAASFDESGQLPEVPQEWMSELKQEPDAARDELLVLRDPPEIFAIERRVNQLVIKGGGRFERVYRLDAVQPAGSQVTFSETSIVAVHNRPEMVITESWELSRDKSTLVLRIKAETPKLQKPLDIRRIYRSSHSF